MNEAETRAEHIDPLLAAAGWGVVEGSRIHREYPVTLGRIEALASLMRRMDMCEEQGSGLDKVLEQVELFQLPPPLFRADGNSTQVALYAPRSFAGMTPEERMRACYFHAVLKFLSGDKMKNASLCIRLGIASKNAAQTTAIINKTLAAGLIRVADPDHPRAGYVPH